MSDSFKKANSYLLGNNQDLQFVFAKIKKLNEINKKVTALIDPAIQRYCQVANLAGNKLVIITSNSSIATQLRFQSPDILIKLKQDPTLSHVREIQCKVGMPQARPSEQNKISREVAQLSPETAQQMLELAKSLDNKKLREIMEKIATHIDEKKRG